MINATLTYPMSRTFFWPTSTSQKKKQLVCREWPVFSDPILTLDDHAHFPLCPVTHFTAVLQDSWGWWGRVQHPLLSPLKSKTFAFLQMCTVPQRWLWWLSNLCGISSQHPPGDLLRSLCHLELESHRPGFLILQPSSSQTEFGSAGCPRTPTNITPPAPSCKPALSCSRYKNNFKSPFLRP